MKELKLTGMIKKEKNMVKKKNPQIIPESKIFESHLEVIF
jgi:hypothetical protein